MIYQGEIVQSRPANVGDEGFDRNLDQVVVILADGTQKTVLRSELTKESKE